MANIVVVLDGDAARRAAYVTAVRGMIAPLPGLLVAACEGTDWAAVWAVAAAAPVSSQTDATGGAVVWGEAIDETGQRQTAAGVRAAWRGDGTATWDGFHAAMVVDGPGRLTVGADVLGIFPVYYWQGPGVVLVGTSPELFTGHPAFRAQLDVTGLVGIMLANGLVGRATLWKGVQRLGPGHQLRVRDGRVTEVETYRLPEAMEAASLPFSGHVELLAEAIGSAVRRHAPSGHRYGLLLSGGLDSRMLAGFLVHAGIAPRLLTIGLPNDLDMRCAAAVAKTLGLEQLVGEPDVTNYAAIAALHARWEHLANGFNTIRDWWIQGQVGQLGDRLVTGGLADAIVGGTAISWAYSAPPPRMSYDAFVANMPQLGIQADSLRKLLRAEHAGAVQEVQDRLRREFHDYGESGSYRAWRYDLAHGTRYHVGATPWRLSFGAWTVLPVLDRDVLRVASSIPASSLADRLAQLALVRTYLPELASVPMDRSDVMSDEPQYLEPRLRQLLGGYSRVRIKDFRRAMGLPVTGRESRYWYRVNNLNGEAWRQVRLAAESSRERVASVFNCDVFDAILPPPDQPVILEGPGVSESGRKLLLGFMHWAGMHLQDAGI